jgi:hypothetical protein
MITGAVLTVTLQVIIIARVISIHCSLLHRESTANHSEPPQIALVVSHSPEEPKVLLTSLWFLQCLCLPPCPHSLCHLCSTSGPLHMLLLSGDTTLYCSSCNGDLRPQTWRGCFWSYSPKCLCYGLNVSPTPKFMCYKLSPQIHVLMVLGGGAFKSRLGFNELIRWGLHDGMGSFKKRDLSWHTCSVPPWDTLHHVRVQHRLLHAPPHHASSMLWELPTSRP